MKTTIIKGLKNGKEIDIPVSQLIMGSGDFLREENLEFAGAVLDRFVELGGNCFDTARNYRHSEKALGAWMDNKKNRDSLVIFTKGCHPTREFRTVNRVTAEAIRYDLDISLKTLRTDHVDLYALHRDNINYPVGAIMHELDSLVKEGRIYAIGTSNWELDRILEANQYASEHDLTPFTFNSPNLSLAKPKIPRWPDCVSANEQMVAWHQQDNMPLISWSAQAGGFFSGKFTANNTENQEMVDVFYNDENWKRYDRAIELAQKKGKTPIQIALAYVLNQKFPSCAAIGPESVEELNSSYEGSQIILSPEEMAYLDLK